jgi:aspartate kinase
VLLATGEQTTAALLAMMLKGMGYKAQSLLGHQAEVVTDCEYGNARILEIGTKRIKRLLADRNIVVVAGFQGVDIKGNITTLGRGGSDTSAVAIAAALKRDICEIYTDVDGIYTADPNICPRARKIKEISLRRDAEHGQPRRQGSADPLGGRRQEVQYPRPRPIIFFRGGRHHGCPGRFRHGAAGCFRRNP